MLQAVMTNGQPVIGHCAVILVRFFERTFGFFDELIVERILFVNRCLTVHAIEIDLVVAGAMTLHEPAHRGRGLHHTKPNLRFLIIVLIELLIWLLRLCQVSVDLIHRRVVL